MEIRPGRRTPLYPGNAPDNVLSFDITPKMF